MYYIGSSAHNYKWTYYLPLVRLLILPDPANVFAPSDIFDADGKLVFQVVLGVNSSTACFGLVTQWWDDDYFSIVRAEDMEKLSWATRHDHHFKIPESSGWVVALRPKFKENIDRCIADCNGVTRWLRVVTLGASDTVCNLLVDLLLAFVNLLRVLPVDHWSQVPNPGTEDVRARSPCTRTISVIRCQLPSNCTTKERFLITGALVYLEFDDAIEFI